MSDENEFFLGGQFQMGRFGIKGPYGTNEGDVWMIGGDLGDRLNAEGMMGIHQMLRTEGGKLNERIYSVELANPDPDIQGLIVRAREGTELYLSARAAQN